MFLRATATGSFLVGTSWPWSKNRKTHRITRNRDIPARCGWDPDLAGNCVVNGDIVLGVNGTASIHGNAVVTGSTTTLATPLACTPIDLARLRSRMSTTNDNASVPPTAKGKSAWEENDEFELEDGDSVSLPEGLYFMTKMQISDSSTVIATGPVTIFVTGEMEISEGSKLLAQPGPITVFSDSDEEFEVKSSEAEMVLYAPSAELKLEGSNGTLFAGSAWVDEAKISGNAVLRRTASLEGGSLREWFRSEFWYVAEEIDSALQETDPVARNAAVDAAIARVEEIRTQMDGSVGGDSTDDWVRDPLRQQALLPMLQDLISRLQTYHLEVAGPPPVIP